MQNIIPISPNKTYFADVESFIALEMINNNPNPKFIEPTTVIGVLNHIIYSSDGALKILATISFGINIKTNNISPTKMWQIPIILNIKVVFKILWMINIYLIKVKQHLKPIQIYSSSHKQKTPLMGGA